MGDIKPDVMERALANKFYWRRLAARIIAESSQNVPREVDSAIAPAPRLGRLIESRLRQTRARLFSSPSPGPRGHPDIIEAHTVSPEGRIPSQQRARRLRATWDQGRIRGQREEQNVDANPTTDAQADDGDNPMRDHPGQACGDAHPGMSHDDFKDQQEEEEEEHGPSPHIPGLPVGKVGKYAADNPYDSPADKPANPDEEEEEEEETRRNRRQHQLDEGQRFEAISIKSRIGANSLYAKHAAKILRQIRK